MANISDSAGIFVGVTLDAFNEMQVRVARDGDVAGAAAEMREACLKVCSTRLVTTSGASGKQTTRRS